MGGGQTNLAGPDLAEGVEESALREGTPLLGHAGGEPVVLVRSGADVLAVGAVCTHYHGPLAEGLVVGDSIRCPWHHASFDLRTGEAVQAPAFDPLPCWPVEQREGRIFVHAKSQVFNRSRHGTPARNVPDRIVIVG